MNTATLKLDQNHLLALDKILQSRTILEGELCRRDFKRFVREAWHVLEPGREFKPSWHIDAIAEHLEAVTNGDIRRLLINMPPRMAKSTLVSVMWPAWTWTNTPERRFITSSYNIKLATRDAVASRRLMESDWYQERFGHIFEFTNDQNEKTRYENDHRGYRVVTSVGPGGTGEGGDILTWDDPIDREAANSAAAVEAANTWWSETMSSRYNDPETGAAVGVMQRLSANDLSAYVLKEGGWVHLCLPMRYESDRTIGTMLGFKDPRTQEGELLAPNRYTEEATQRLERELGSSYAIAGQLQQRPTPRGGGVLKSAWFVRYQQLPAIKSRKIFADTASKTKAANDFSVFQLWGQGDNGKIYLLDQLRGKWDGLDLLRRCIDFYNKHAAETETFNMAPVSQLIIEDASSGIQLIADLKKELKLPVKAVKRVKDKYTRALDAEGSLESGYVCVPDSAPWLNDYLDEFDNFTPDDSHEHDDQIDPTLDAIIEYINRPRTAFDAIAERMGVRL